MSKSAKQIAAELDQTRSRLDASLAALRREASPMRLARLGASQDWSGLVTKASGWVAAVRDLVAGRR